MALVILRRSDENGDAMAYILKSPEKGCGNFVFPEEGFLIRLSTEQTISRLGRMTGLENQPIALNVYTAECVSMTRNVERSSRNQTRPPRTFLVRRKRDVLKCSRLIRLVCTMQLTSSSSFALPFL